MLSFLYFLCLEVCLGWQQQRESAVVGFWCFYGIHGVVGMCGFGFGWCFMFFIVDLLHIAVKHVGN